MKNSSPFILCLILGLVAFSAGCANAPCTGFSVSIVNKSQITNGTIIHLSDDDLGKYPELASLILHSQKNAANPSMKTTNNMTDLGNVEFSCSEQSRVEKYRGITAHAMSPSDMMYLEYNGTFYLTGMIWIH